MEEYMESELSGILRVKLVTKNIVRGSPGTQFMHMTVNLVGLCENVQISSSKPWEFLCMQIWTNKVFFFQAAIYFVEQILGIKLATSENFLFHI